ncbi:MAG: outer membrane protein OmpK [Pseudomonadota bacterium]
MKKQYLYQCLVNFVQPVSTPFLKFSSLLLLPMIALCLPAHAGSAQWSSTNIQYLYGTTYSSIYFNGETNKLDSEDTSASVITLEHVNGWKYGDNFYFVDITNADRNDPNAATGYYGELSPRFSLSSITGAPLSGGIIKDVLVTTTAEIGQGFHNYLYGLAIDFNIPNTPVAQLNYYIRNEIGAGKDTGQQITLVWLKPFKIGSAAFTFEGFLDYAFAMDHAEDNIIAAPRLLYDLGNSWGSPGCLQVGVEYQLWRNKFGIDGIDEDVAQVMAKWIW